MAKKRAGKVEESNQAGSVSEPELTPDEKLLSSVYSLCLPTNGLRLPTIESGTGEVELIRINLLELTIRRGRKLVELCRFAETGLLTTDPIPRDLVEPAYHYLESDWISLTSVLLMLNRRYFKGHRRVSEPESVLIDTLGSESIKLSYLLRYLDPNGRLVEVHETEDETISPEFEYDGIEPRNALQKTRKVVDFIGSCLNQLESAIKQSTPEPLTPQQIKFEESVDLLAINLNPNKLSPLRYEILVELFDRNTNLGPGDISGFLKARGLEHRTDSIKTQLTKLKEKGFVGNPAYNSWVITDAGYGYLKNDVRFRTRKVIRK